MKLLLSLTLGLLVAIYTGLPAMLALALEGYRAIAAVLL